MHPYCIFTGLPPPEAKFPSGSPFPSVPIGTQLALQCGILPQNGVFISRINDQEMHSENETQFWDKVWNMIGLLKKSKLVLTSIMLRPV